jgi:hypothetical protein
MTEPNAKVIADSISEWGSRLITVEATFHRFVLAEFNTHRVMSRNSASSRAIPVEKQIKRVLEDPAVPLRFGTNQPGMQSGPPLSGAELDEAREIWLCARDRAIESAQLLLDQGVHKEVTNRLLEPFMWHTAIITATEWGNFFSQRISPLAQPEICAVATAIKEAIDASVPTRIGQHEWHLPYIQPDEVGLDVELLKKLSAARCARVSYLTHDGTRDHDKDLELFDRLVGANPPHASPLEHVATPIGDEFDSNLGNLYGWHQLRHTYFD